MEPRLCARTAQRDGVRRRRQQSRPILKAPPAPRMARAASEIVEVEEARGDGVYLHRTSYMRMATSSSTTP